MKLKTTEIAKQLGISKATVSLALNNKPGVKSETKKMILNYIEQYEKGKTIDISNNIIKIIYYTQEQHLNNEVDLWSGVLAEFTREAKRDQLNISVDYITSNKKEIEQSIDQCNDELVKGVILFANELDENTFLKFNQINKPMIIYDNNYYDHNYSYVMIDNYQGIKKILNHYQKINQTKIIYLANTKSNYNFNSRQKAFVSLCQEFKMEGKIIQLGNEVEEICNNFLEFYQSDFYAFICEDYHVSIGVIKAIHELNLEFNSDLMLVGIDEIPDYFCYGHKLTALRISHNQRAFMAITLLKQEMLNPNCDKFTIYSSCQLIEGDTA